MFDIGIAIILIILALAMGNQPHKYWTRANYFIYYLLWFVAAFFGTYGFIDSFLK